MGSNISNLHDMFYGLRNCQKQIHKIFPKDKERNLDLPVQQLHESFALCSGSFYYLNLYQEKFGDLFIDEKNILPHGESWKLFDRITDFDDFNHKTEPPSVLIKNEFRSMCIANAAFRLPSAGYHVSDIVRKIKNHCSDRSVFEALEKSWDYSKFLGTKDWSRKELEIQGNTRCDFGSNPDTPQFRIALLICMRDEYGHTEYHKDHQCRQGLLKKYYKKKIVWVETKFLRETISAINTLCQYHDQEKIDLTKKI